MCPNVSFFLIWLSYMYECEYQRLLVEQQADAGFGPAYHAVACYCILIPDRGGGEGGGGGGGGGDLKVRCCPPERPSMCSMFTIEG
jgi:hypothetical protein